MRARLLATLSLIWVLCAPALAQQSITDIAEDFSNRVASDLDAESIERLNSITAAEGDPLGLEMLGHVILMERHLDEATYLYAQSVLAEPSRGTAMTALGASMGERLTLAEAATLADWETITQLQEAAVEALPDEAGIRFNLGSALLQQARLADDNEALLERAIESLRQAIDLSPNHAQFWTRLAEALDEAGDTEGAQMALTQAFLLDSLAPSLIAARQQPAFSGYSPSPGNQCTVNFNCAVACPGGIIGGLKRVTCEIEQSGALNACMRGEPYPTTYNCDIEFPRFGIMIPGLYPGFSAVTPWGSLDVILQGNGNVDWRAKVNTPDMGGLQFYLQAEGRWSPNSGMARWDMSGGAQYGLMNRGTVLPEFQRYNLGPELVYNIDPNKADPDEIRFDVSRGPVLTL